VLEARRWAFASEQARLGALAVAGVVLLTRGALMPGLGLALLCVGSLAALWTRRHAFTAMSDERMDFHHA
jgi:hypothetical protein